MWRQAIRTNTLSSLFDAKLCENNVDMWRLACHFSSLCDMSNAKWSITWRGSWQNSDHLKEVMQIYVKH
jgi:hypothetical protein